MNPTQETPTETGAGPFCAIMEPFLWLACGLLWLLSEAWKDENA